MPIFDYACENCKNIWENIEVWKSHVPKACPKCGSTNFNKVISCPLIRMDPDTILKSVPDPTPPLEELRGKTKRGCLGGYSDKPHASTELKSYTRRKDKYGNSIWTERRRLVVDLGKNKTNEK
jgi:putative FmdB family regulatory protein